MLNLNPTNLPAAVRRVVYEWDNAHSPDDERGEISMEVLADLEARILAWHQGQLAKVTAAGLGRQFKRDGIIGDERAAYSRLEAERDHLRADLDAECKKHAALLRTICQHNVEVIGDGGVRICFGGHHRSSDCEWVEYEPRSALAATLATARRLRAALDGFLGFVAGGYTIGISPEYDKTLHILARHARETLTDPK